MASADLAGDEYFVKTLTEAKLGLKFNGEEITTVTPGGWAESVGIEVDDEISKVGDVSFKSLTHKERVQLLVEGKRPLDITFKRPLFKDMYYNQVLTDRKIGMTMKGKYVKTVEPTGWAARVGVEVGDEIAELGAANGEISTYTSLSDEERLKIFSGPRPLNIRFVRRNQKTKSALTAAEREKMEGVEKSLNSPEKGVDPTHDDTTADDLRQSELVVAKSSGGAFCACCSNGSVDKKDELAVGE